MSFINEYNKLKSIIDTWNTDNTDIYTGSIAIYNKKSTPIIFIDYGYILNDSSINKYPVSEKFDFEVSYYSDAVEWQNINDKLDSLLAAFQNSDLTVTDVVKRERLLDNRPLIGWTIAIR